MPIQDGRRFESAPDAGESLVDTRYVASRPSKHGEEKSRGHKVRCRPDKVSKFDEYMKTTIGTDEAIRAQSAWIANLFDHDDFVDEDLDDE